MSALANAEHNYDMNTDELVVKEAYANEGPTLKRFRPRAQGRASAINKRTSHITIVVSDGKKKLKKLNNYLRREHCGSKINPIGLRVGIIRDWEAKWYAEKDFASLLHEDLRIRKFIDNELKEASVSHVEIERAANRINIAIHTGKPGMVIGKGGSEIEKLRNKLNNLTDKKYTSTLSKSKIDIDARLVAENIARQLENRASFRRVQNKLFQEL